jgi:quercetin dioxygenase-like cupin family protein
MIRHKAQIPHEIREHLFGGQGSLDCIPLLTGDEFHGKGRMYSVNTLKPGHRVGVHTHKGDFEAYYILKGEGLYNDNGVETRVKAGDITYTWDGESHGLLNDGAGDLEMIALILFTGK